MFRNGFYIFSNILACENKFFCQLFRRVIPSTNTKYDISCLLIDFMYVLYNIFTSGNNFLKLFRSALNL